MARAAIVQDAETLPEIDRLEDFPHPRDTARLYGHDAAEASLAHALQSGRLHHAWLLTGPSGIGKATLAYRFAVAALADTSERDAFGMSLAVDAGTTASRQVRAMSHPGLLVIRRQYNMKDKRFPQSISVDEVRRLRTFLGHRGAEAQWRVVIVDSADELNIPAANALLKSLEEPPQRTVFLLVSSEPGRLLATIRSRCRRLDLAPLSAPDLQRAAGDAFRAAGRDSPEPAEWATLARLGEGSVRHLLSLQAAGGLALYEQVFAILGGLPDVAWEKVHQLADTLAPAAAEVKFELFFDLLLGLLARLVRAEATDTGEDAERRLAARIIGPNRLATLAEVWETVAREKAETVALNLDRKTLILKTVSRLETAVR